MAVLLRKEGCGGMCVTGGSARGQSRSRRAGGQAQIKAGVTVSLTLRPSGGQCLFKQVSSVLDIPWLLCCPWELSLDTLDKNLVDLC